MGFIEELTSVFHCGGAQKLLEELVQGRVVGEQVFQYGQQERDRNGVEIVVDVEFIGPAGMALKGFVQVQDGVVGLEAATEGVAVGGKTVVVSVKEERHDLEQRHGLWVEAIDDSFLAGTHLVDPLFLGDAEAAALGDGGGHPPETLVGDEVVGLLELMPRKTPFHQPVGEKLLPDFLLVELSDDAFHSQKGKRGMTLNQQNCCSQDGTHPGCLQSRDRDVLHPSQARRGRIPFSRFFRSARTS